MQSFSQAPLCLCPLPPGITFSGQDAHSLEGLSGGCQVTNWQAMSPGASLDNIHYSIGPQSCKAIFYTDFISTLTGDLSLGGGLTLIKLMRLIYKTRYRITNLQGGITGARTEKFEVHSNSAFYFWQYSQLYGKLSHSPNSNLLICNEKNYCHRNQNIHSPGDGQMLSLQTDLDKKPNKSRMVFEHRIRTREGRGSNGVGVSMPTICHSPHPFLSSGDLCRYYQPVFCL